MNALISNDPVVEIKVCGEARYFIAMGRPGFNLRANNLNGYATREAAEKASLKCECR